MGTRRERERGRGRERDGGREKEIDRDRRTDKREVEVERGEYKRREQSERTSVVCYLRLALR